jgi:hypothetical protein
VKGNINTNIDAISNSVNVCNSTVVVSHDATICSLICVFYSRHSRQTAFYDSSPPDNSMHSVETMFRVGYGLHVCRWVEIQNWFQAAQVICFYFVRTFCLHHQGRMGIVGSHLRRYRPEGCNVYYLCENLKSYQSGNQSACLMNHSRIGCWIVWSQIALSTLFQFICV